jgi:hypothetical protein
LAGLRRSAAIAHDREQPSPSRAVAELREGTKSPKERILDDILAEHRVARQITCKIIGPIEVRQDDLPESVGLAGAGPGDARRRTFAGP